MEDQGIALPIEHASAAELRHSLRTALNHVIGYSEMIVEAIGEGALPAFEVTDSLHTLIFNAKEIVKSVHAKLKSDDEQVSAHDLHDLQGWLVPPVLQLSSDVEKLGFFAPELFPQDQEKIRLAINRLLALAQNRPEPRTEHSGAGANSLQQQSGREDLLLVVDDNPNNREILSRHLERQGFSVSTAANGQQALDILAQGSYDLVLLDVIMPVMDGFEVLKEIQASSALRSTPVIMISALEEDSNVIRCIQMGAEDYLMKPFDPVLLNARIGASLEKKKLRDKERRRAEELQSALDELQRTQDQLLVQEKLASLGALTAGIAHEIKNPLNFIINFASLSRDLVQEIKEEIGQGESLTLLLNQLEQNVATIEEHGKRADRIVRGMLMHSRGKSGEREWIDLNQTLNEAANLAYHGMRAMDRGFNVKIETDFDSTVGSLKGVPQDLNRVFLNVINNAYYAAYERKKFSNEGFQPTVTIATRNMGTAVEISVQDNGLGIPQDVLNKVFHPFFTTKPAGSGTGLGLSISYDIVVRGHQGSIHAESIPGQFTRFVTTLPRDTA